MIAQHQSKATVLFESAMYYHSRVSSVAHRYSAGMSPSTSTQGLAGAGRHAGHGVVAYKASETGVFLEERRRGMVLI